MSDRGDLISQTTTYSTSARGTQSLDRALTILVELSERSPVGCSLKEMAEVTGIPRPTVHRLLSRLLSSGLVMQERGTRLYKIGPFFHTIEAFNSRNRRLAEVGIASLERLTARFGVTTLLIGRSGRFAQCCARVVCDEQALPAMARLGEDSLLGTSAAGIVILAGLHEEQVEDILFENRWMIVHYGRHDLDKVQEMVETTRRLGYCIANETFVPDIWAMASAIPAPLGRSFAAISIVTDARHAPGSAEIGAMSTMLQQEGRRIAELLREQGLLP